MLPKNFGRGVLVPACFLLAISADCSQAEPDNPAELYITANRYPTEAKKTGSSISVLNEEEIKASKQQTVLEVLRNVPGLNVVQTGGPGRATSVFLRGSESDHTLVLIDGVRVNTNASGEFDLANLKAENIERIEVIRGAQSVLYGSEAIGGIINIISKRTEDELEASLKTTAGSFGTQDYLARVGTRSENTHISFSASYFDNDGFSATSEDNGNTERDSHDNLTLSGIAGAEFLGDGEVVLSARYSNASSDIDGFEFGVGPTDDPNSVQDTDLFSGSLGLSKPLAEWLEARVTLGLTDESLEGRDPDTEFSNFEIENQSHSVVTQLEFTPLASLVSILGHSFEHRKAENIGSFESQRDVNAFFLENQLQASESATLTAGVRHDINSDFGEETTFRTSASVQAPNNFARLHASFGTGFKAPSFNELFFPGFGNPELDAETSWGYDIGVEVPVLDNRIVFDVTFFQSRIDDLIVSDSETFLAANISEAEIWGIESSAKLKLGEFLSATLNYTFQEAENEDTGLQLARRPKHQGGLTLISSPVEPLELSLGFVLVRDRIDSDMTDMDDYEVVNFAASYQVNPNLRPFFRIDNLFDQNYEEVNGFESSDFAAYGGLEISL